MNHGDGSPHQQAASASSTTAAITAFPPWKPSRCREGPGSGPLRRTAWSVLRRPPTPAPGQSPGVCGRSHRLRCGPHESRHVWLPRGSDNPTRGGRLLRLVAWAEGTDGASSQRHDDAGVPRRGAVPDVASQVASVIHPQGASMLLLLHWHGPVMGGADPLTACPLPRPPQLRHRGGSAAKYGSVAVAMTADG